MGDCPGTPFVIPGQHHGPDTCTGEPLHCIGRTRPHLVGNRDQADQISTPPNQNNGSAFVLEAGDGSGSHADVNALLRQSPGTANEARLIIDPCRYPEPGCLMELFYWEVAEGPVLPGFPDNRCSERMAGPGFEAAGQVQHLVCPCTVECKDIRYLGAPDGQGPGLIEGNDLYLVNDLQVRPSFEDRTMPGCVRHRPHDGNWDREGKAA